MVFFTRSRGTRDPTSSRGTIAPSQGSAVLRFVTALIDTERRMCYNALVSNTRKAECNDNYIHNAH